MISIPKIIITIGFLLSFHSAYSVAKNRNYIYNAHNSIDFAKFPIEIMIEITMSFIFVIFGSLIQYSKFEEIYYHKQMPDKVVNHLQKNMFCYIASKGGMINHYLNLEK